MVWMSTELRTSIDIDAPAAAVWAVLTDLAAYPDWNPFIVCADGEVAVGGKLSLTMQPVGARRTTVRPTVVEVEPGRRLRWRGKLGLAAVFAADHSITLDERAGGVRLTQAEMFRGVLVPLLAQSLRTHTLPAFDAMNEAIKRRVERAPAPQRG
jgi:hypothetical protein